MKPSRRGVLFFFLSAAIISLPHSLCAEPVSLKRVVELALSHATGAAIAAADEQHAAASVRELRNSYIPQLILGRTRAALLWIPLVDRRTATVSV